MSEISYKYDISVPSVNEGKLGVGSTYTMSIRTMPVQGHKVLIKGSSALGIPDLRVGVVTHYISIDKEEYIGDVNCSNLNAVQASVLLQILKEIGVKTD